MELSTRDTLYLWFMERKITDKEFEIVLEKLDKDELQAYNDGYREGYNYCSQSGRTGT